MERPNEKPHEISTEPFSQTIVSVLMPTSFRDGFGHVPRNEIAHLEYTKNSQPYARTYSKSKIR